MPNLRGITPITEANKTEWINWLGQALDSIEQADYDDYSFNRIFGTSQDDIDEVKGALGAMFLTLQQFNITPKTSSL
jgi:hypothetical protein